MTEDRRLVAMRLVDMWKVHPAQDNSHVCCECGQKVGIYPTGQKALKAYPAMTIMCSHCALNERQPDDKAEPAGPIDEIIQEMKASKPASRA